MVGCRVGVPGAVIVLSVKVSAELDAVIGCWGTDKKWPSCGGCDHHMYPPIRLGNFKITTKVIFSNDLCKSVNLGGVD